MQLTIERPRQEKRIRFSGSARDLLASLDINPETVLVVKNDTLIALDDEVADTDAVRVLSVISGG